MSDTDLNDMIFNLDISRWIDMMLPSFLRRPRIRALCNALCSPVGDIHSRFADTRAGHLFDLAHNAQVCHLRHALNSSFCLGFDITDTQSSGAEWIFAFDSEYEDDALLIPHGSHPPDQGMVVWSEQRLSLTSDSFIVTVPATAYDNALPAIRDMVDRFRLPSKKPLFNRSS